MPTSVQTSFTSTVPTRCIERHPTTQTVWFAGVPINLSHLAESYAPPLSVAQLSRVFAGKQGVSLAMAKKLALGLGMQLQAFVEALDKERE